MSSHDPSGTSPKHSQKYHHFKVVSEGGSYLAESPGGTPACQSQQQIFMQCQSPTMTREFANFMSGSYTTLPPSDRFLFSLPLEHAPELDQGHIPESLRQEFKSKGIPLSPTTRLNVMHVGKIWFITDKERRYYVRMVPTMLYVYTE
jgi:hypothetical protein